jgi:TolA-binding protein
MRLVYKSSWRLLPRGRSGLLATIALAATLTTTLAPGAWAQVDSREGIALQNEIYQLRSQIQQLQNQQGSGGGGGYQPAPRISGNTSDLVTQLLTRVDNLEDQVRQLRGSVEELQNQAQQQSLDLNKKIDDLKFQLGQGSGAAQPQGTAPLGAAPNQGLPGSGYQGSPQPNYPASNYPPQGYPPSPQPGYLTVPQPGQTASAPPPPPQAAPPPARPNAPRTPEMAMQEGNAALARRDYAAAESAAREVLANRTSPRAYDAKLLLAQALEGEKQFPQAAVAFDDAYNWSRKGSHAQDSLVGLANALTAIKETKAACDTIGRLRSDFPQVRPDLRPAVAAAAQKAGCH